MFHKKRNNMLVMKPILKEHYRLEPSPDEDTQLILVVPRTGWLERLSIRWLGQPEAIRVQLDELGSFVLSRCDGSGEDLHLVLEDPATDLARGETVELSGQVTLTAPGQHCASGTASIELLAS